METSPKHLLDGAIFRRSLVADFVAGGSVRLHFRNPVFEFSAYGWPTVHAVQIHDGQQFSDEEFKGIVDFRHSIIWTTFEKEELRWVNRFQGENYWDRRFGKVSRKRFWSQPRNWNYLESNSRWHWDWRGVLINLALFSIYLTAVAALLERFRRQKRNWYQLTMRGGLTALLIFAIFWAFIGNDLYDVRTQTKAIVELQKYAEIDSMYIENETPVWLDRLFDGAFQRSRKSEWCFRHFDKMTNWPRINGETQLPLFSKVDGINLKVSDGAAAARELNAIVTDQIQLLLDEDKTEAVEFLSALDPGAVEMLLIYSGIHDEKFHLTSSEILRPVSRFENLDFLALDDLEFGFELESWPETRSLRLDSNCTDPDGILKNWFRKSTQLREVDGGAILINAIDALPEQLESLRIVIETDNCDLGPISRLVKLNSFWIESDLFPQSLQELGFEFSAFSSLSEITFAGIQHNEKTLQWIESLPAVEQIHLRGYDLPDEQKERLRAEFTVPQSNFFAKSVLIDLPNAK